MEKMCLKFNAKSQNESFARTCVSAFILQLNPSIEELSDVKTAVSEAVTNAVVHAYPNKDNNSDIIIECEIQNNVLHINIIDFGLGIADIKSALEPFYTTKSDEERSGMGFSIMSTFMDELEVSSSPKGTTISMRKFFKSA